VAPVTQIRDPHHKSGWWSSNDLAHGGEEMDEENQVLVGAIGKLALAGEQFGRAE